MIAKPPRPGFLMDLQMPLRDALRGVASLADATEDMLEPAARLLPEPIRVQFRDAMLSLERAGKRLVHAPIGKQEIASAAGVLGGTQSDRSDIDTCATVVVYAWDHLNETGAEQRHLISETVLADRLARTRNASRQSGADFGAELVADIRRSSAIGRMPGLARGIPAEAAAEIDLALIAISVWLLSTRAGSLEEEERLLDLSMALVRAMRADALEALDDPGRLARFLADTSAHL